MLEIIPNWHPVFVHFTVGLLMAAVGLYCLSALLPVNAELKQQWFSSANWCLWVGVAITVPPLLTGLYAYNTVNHDEASPSVQVRM